jgi:GTP-binding protein
MLDFRKTVFLKSAAKLDQCPPDIGAEVAFVGRSNSGKSSALNMLTGDNKLARVSKTPGRTQLLNFFDINGKHRLVDLPGYGYASVPLKQKLIWQETLEEYLQARHSLRAIVLLMDIRHPLKPVDQQILIWAAAANIHTHILLSKADKVSRSAGLQVLKEVEQAIKAYGEYVSVQLFSVLNNIGVADFKSVLNQLMG